MTEPDWNSVQSRMMALTLKRLAPVKILFLGCLGGASTKAEIIATMVSQMRHWWRSGARDRAIQALQELEKVEEKCSLI
jgi:hypothetical protein